MNGGRPAVLVVLALAGLAISGYLAAFQLGLIGAPWDPIFGDGSRLVLRSAIARLLPVPDASIGAAGYAVDAILAALVAAGVSGTPRLAVALAVIASIGAVVGVALAAFQAVVVGAFCTLCLCSSLVSVVLAFGAVGEARQWLAHDPTPRSRRTEATE